MKTIISLVVVVLVVGGAVTYYVTQIAAEPTTNFRTVKVVRGDLPDTITATGTVEPEEVLDVGAQVAGRIEFLGPDYRRPRGSAAAKAVSGRPVPGKPDQPIKGKPDSVSNRRKHKSLPAGTSPSPADKIKFEPIDYTSVVDGPVLAEDGTVIKEGTLLAQIDDDIYGAQCDAAKAARDRAAADVKQAKAKLHQAGEELRRADELRTLPPIPATKDRPAIKIISDSDYDLIKVNQEVAAAGAAVAEAALEQAESALTLAQTNLDYTVIRSPVDGVIVDRRVNVGQTVVASLNAPSLFLIAKDLKRMQVWASVNEADIGRIKPGCKVTFTVDTFPNEVFEGKVSQIRLNAQMTQNVVLYTVVVAFDNSAEKLKPYLTANATFEIEKHHDVLLVPNAALRWRPRPDQVVPELREKLAAGLSLKGGKDAQSPGRPGGGAPPPATPARERTDRGRLWVQEGKFVRPVDVQIIFNDGMTTGIAGEEVKEGMEVVLGLASKEGRGEGGETSPFAPKMFRGKKQ